MSTCDRCEKSGFFLSLHKGLCLECAKQVQNELVQANQFIQNNYAAFKTLTVAANVTLDEALEAVTPLIKAFNCISQYSSNGWASGFEDLIDVEPLFLAEADKFIVRIHSDHVDKIVDSGMDISSIKEMIKLTQSAKNFFSTYSQSEELIRNFEQQECQLKDTLAELIICEADILESKTELDTYSAEKIKCDLDLLNSGIKTQQKLAKVMKSEAVLLKSNPSLEKRLSGFLKCEPDKLDLNDLKKCIAELSELNEQSQQ